MTRPPVPAIMMLAAALAVCALAGCAPDGGESPSPEPTVEAATPSPSPQWTAEQQGAIDAVQKYLEVWTDISQNLQTADLDQIRDVASDPAANDAVMVWTQWYQNGWHLVGGPVFTPDYVTTGALDYLGQRYHVHGCFSISEGYLIDANGTHIGDRGNERGTADYLVIFLENGRHLVLEDTPEDKPC